MESEITLAPNFVSALLSWYDANGRDLPWRDHPDPYAVLVSEFMLQQTTVPAAIPYFEKWIEVFPTIVKLAAAEPDQVLRLWEGLGYYSRARNLHRTAKEIVRHHGGTIPEDPRRLKAFPGIGDYTAAAVASIAYGARAPALDANSLRVWSRLLASTDRNRITEVFARILPPERPGDFNQALMDLGASVCLPGDPECLMCPVHEWCRAFGSGKVSEYPARKVPPNIERIEAAIGIVMEKGKILVQKRSDSGLLAGLWEFPGGKIKSTEGGGRRAEKKRNPESRIQNPGDRRQEAGDSKNHSANPGEETPEEAVVREVREETGLKVQVREKLGVFTHSYTRFRVRLHVFLCKGKGGTLSRLEAKWVTLAELENLPMPSASRRIVSALEKHFQD